MGIERTFCMLKPGVLQRRLVGEVLGRLERKGLKIIAMKMVSLSKEIVSKHYEEHIGKDFFQPLLEFAISGPAVLMVVEGNEAIKVLRILCGATNVLEAQPGTIRGDLCGFTRKNIIHASDSPESSAREIGLFFKPEEIQNWNDDNQSWIM